MNFFKVQWQALHFCHYICNLQYSQLVGFVRVDQSWLPVFFQVVFVPLEFRPICHTGDTKVVAEDGLCV